MDLDTRLKTSFAAALYKKGGLNMSQCADAVGKSVSLLSRMISLNDDVPISTLAAVQIMKLKKEYSLFETIADELGFVVVKTPSAGMKKGDINQVASDYQMVTSEAGDAVVKFLNSPDTENYKRAISALHNVIGQSAAVEKRVKKMASQQLEMEF